MPPSFWNPENIRDVGESIGVNTLSREVTDHLGHDIDFRIMLVIDSALKFMKNAKRTTLHTDDISQALKVLDIEPLFGYESTRPLRFGEATIAPGQPLFYVEDEEVDFEKLINAPLPKVPREITFTAHWLAVEGVQPSIPQNPTSADPRHQEMLPKGPGVNSHLAAIAGLDNTTAKPQVKHILSSEIQLYFERITSAILDDTNEEYRSAALNSLRTDPGLHQLVPYFIQYAQEKVTHSMKDIFTLRQMLALIQALLSNPSLFLDPYVSKIIPPILTCLQAHRPGLPTDPLPSIYELRDSAASLLIAVARKYGKSSQTLRPKLARSLLKTFLNPRESFGAHYGALMGFLGITGAEGIRMAILPNLKIYDEVLREGLEDEGGGGKRAEAEMVVMALLACLARCVVGGGGGAGVGAGAEADDTSMVNGDGLDPDVEAKVVEKIGEVLGRRVVQSGQPRLVKAVLDSSYDF